MNAALKFEFDLSNDGDSWGNVMDWMFSIADVLHHAEENVPEGWGYNHSSLCTGEQSYVAEWMRFELTKGYLDAHDLVEFGNLLLRYADILEAEGRSY